MCWPANIVGIFFVALIIFDIVQKEYSSLPYHGILGVCVTGLLWGLCWLIGPSATMATLIVPLIFAGIFLFTIWFTNESMKKRGCCMTCNGDTPKKGRLVKRDTPKDGTTNSDTTNSDTNSSTNSGTTNSGTTSVTSGSGSSGTGIKSGKVSGSCIPSLKAVSL